MSDYKNRIKKFLGIVTAGAMLSSSSPAMGQVNQQFQNRNVKSETPAVKHIENMELPEVDQSFEAEMDQIDREPEKVEIYRNGDKSLVRFSGFDGMEQYEDTDGPKSMTFEYPRIEESEILPSFMGPNGELKPVFYTETSSGKYSAFWNPFEVRMSIEEVEERPPRLIDYTLGLIQAAENDEE